jgi:hypothetical protein
VGRTKNVNTLTAKKNVFTQIAKKLPQSSKCASFAFNGES